MLMRYSGKKPQKDTHHFSTAQAFPINTCWELELQSLKKCGEVGLCVHTIVLRAGSIL